MIVAVLPVHIANIVINELLSRDLVDRNMRIQRSDTEVLVPLIRPALPEDISERYSIAVKEVDGRTRHVRSIPIDEVRSRLRDRGQDSTVLNAIPDKWERIGEVLILKFPVELTQWKSDIAAIYAEVLGVKTVIEDKGGIVGTERVPITEVLIGTDTETVHTENGVRYAIDTARIMFSSGNIDERIRMASIKCAGETILDMFSGIGYFSLPLAVHQQPKRIYSCEIRKLAYEYLVKNIRLNGVEDVIKPHLTDNRDFEPPCKVDRVIMGYLRDTHEFLPKALSSLRSGGIVHYHENFPNDQIRLGRPEEYLRRAAGNKWKVDVLGERCVKSFSPGVSHIVLDARFTLI